MKNLIEEIRRLFRFGVSLLILLAFGHSAFGAKTFSEFDHLIPQSDETKLVLRTIDEAIGRKTAELDGYSDDTASAWLKEQGNPKEILRDELKSLIKEKSRMLRDLARSEAKVKKFDFSFNGGTIEELAAHILDVTDNQLSIVVPSVCSRGVEIFPFELSGVEIDGVFNMLNTYWSRSGSRSIWMRSGDKVWVLSGERIVVDLPLRVVIKNVGDLLTDYSIESISTAIKAAWGMLDTTVAPSFKFHPETNLLIFKGRVDDIQIAISVLEELRGIDRSSTQN